MNETSVVTVFLRHQGEVLLVRRSENVSSYPGKWAAIAGHLETEDPIETALQEIEEEAGLSEDTVTLASKGPSFSVEDDDRDTRWTVHPFLFSAASREITLNWESDQAEWVSPTTILRRETVPKLWRSYRSVAPSIVDLTDDTSHGSAFLSLRALEILRDRAGRLATTETPDIEDARARLVETAKRLLSARPAMAALRNRVHRVMHASRPELTPASVEANAHDAIGRAMESDTETARRAADQTAGQRVLTLSRSGTVLEALLQAEPRPSVVIAASQPGGEGIPVAETLSTHKIDVTLIPDAAVGSTLAQGHVDSVLVGADTVSPGGAVVNKVGTRHAALAAHHENVPFYATCSIDKIMVENEGRSMEEADPRLVYEGAAPINVSVPRFDKTPPDLLSGGIITNRGTYAPEEIEAVAEELEHFRAWI